MSQEVFQRDSSLLPGFFRRAPHVSEGWGGGRGWTVACVRGVVGYKPEDSGFSVVVLLLSVLPSSSPPFSLWLFSFSPPSSFRLHSQRLFLHSSTSVLSIFWKLLSKPETMLTFLALASVVLLGIGNKLD